jgi:hypothetical protein
MRAILGAVVVAALPAWAPAWGFEGHYEGQATFVVGNRFCPVQGPALKFEISADGKVAGTAKQAVPLAGTVSSDGTLTATYKAPTESEPVTIEAKLTDQTLEGFSQSASCKYKISFTRQQSQLSSGAK